MRTFLLLTALLTACGTSTVQMVVVRPAVVNAHPYGGTVAISGFASARPEFAYATEALRQDVARRVVESVGGVVRVVDGGAGLVAGGALVDHGVTWTERSREATCTDTVRVVQDGITTNQQVQRPCTWRWWDWIATVRAHLRVTTAQGQMLYWKPHYAEQRGNTHEHRDAPPQSSQPMAPPDLTLTLTNLRLQVAEQMAAVLAPHRVHVSATFFDCADPAKQTCADGVRLFANSRYDEAANAFTMAIDQLTRAGVSLDDQARAWWDRALVWQYSRRFDQALADLRKSCELEHRSWCDAQMREVEVERQNHLKLVDEGLGK